MRVRLPLILVDLLIGAAAFSAIDSKILGLFHDDGIYAVAAKALADGDGYRIVSLPGGPAQTKYPFLYSTLLSLIWRISPPFPDNIVFLKSLNVIILLAIFLISFVYYRREINREFLNQLLKTPQRRSASRPKLMAGAASCGSMAKHHHWEVNLGVNGRALILRR